MHKSPILPTDDGTGAAAPADEGPGSGKEQEGDADPLAEPFSGTNGGRVLPGA